MEVGGQHLALAALPPGKTQYTLYRRLVWTCAINLAHGTGKISKF
jgi:hypothetical protein